MSSRAPERDRLRRMMVAALDGELSPPERGELDGALAADAELRAEWERLRGVKEVMKTMSLERPPEEVWEGYWLSVYNRLERGLGWILVSVGSVVLVGFGLWEAVQGILADTSLPGFVKVAIFVLLLGLVALALSVVREKLFTARRDPYKEVQR